jgi:hypothetical protein
MELILRTNSGFSLFNERNLLSHLKLRLKTKAVSSLVLVRNHNSSKKELNFIPNSMTRNYKAYYSSKCFKVIHRPRINKKWK